MFCSLSTYQDALTKLSTEMFNSKGGLKKTVEIKNQPLGLGSGTKYSLDASGNLLSSSTSNYTAIFKLDPSNNNYKLVTLFPQ